MLVVDSDGALAVGVTPVRQGSGWLYVGEQWVHPVADGAVHQAVSWCRCASMYVSCVCHIWRFVEGWRVVVMGGVVGLLKMQPWQGS